MSGKKHIIKFSFCFKFQKAVKPKRPISGQSFRGSYFLYIYIYIHNLCIYIYTILFHICAQKTPNNSESSYAKILFCCRTVLYKFYFEFYFNIINPQQFADMASVNF